MTLHARCGGDRGPKPENVQDLEANDRHGEEIHRDQVLEVVLEERAPRLRGRLSAPHHGLADGGLPDVDVQLEQLAVDPRGPTADSPGSFDG